MSAGIALAMNRLKLLWAVLMCFGFSLVYAAAQTQPAAGPPASAPATPLPPAKIAPAPLPDPKTPEEFFARARQLSDLEAAGIPFHLKATYVASGDAEFTGNGTYEVWWQSKDLWRTEATLGDYKYVAIKNDGKQTAAATAAYIPLRVREDMGLEIFHIAMPEKKQEEWELSQGAGGSGPREVATKEQPCDPRHKKLVCTQQFEFSEGLLQSYRVNDLSETYRNFQPFEKLFFPREISMALPGDSILAMNIVSLEALSDADHGLMNTKIPADLPAEPSQIFEDIPAKDVTPPKLIHSARVKYPKSERKRHPNRLVIVACAIDATGAVREPYVQLSGGAAFDRAAMDAVRKYHFSPATKNGVPGMTDLNLVVDFRFF